MIDELKHYLWDLRDRQRIAIALAKGGATMNARRIRLEDPVSWEFSGFSQNGEDGILDVLRSQLRRSNRYFIEIGASDGIENNSGWLVVAEQYGGLMVEGNRHLLQRAERTVLRYSVGAESVHMFVRRDNMHELLSRALHTDPDVFSLDIDGNDYYIAEAAFDAGLRPKIVAVEYNSAFGPQRSCTVRYRDDFDYSVAHPTKLYYGVSVAGWRRFFERRGYRFVTVDRHGVNAFFVDPQHFASAFLDALRGTEFVENDSQLRRFRFGHAEQFQLIADQPLVTIE